MKFDFSDSKVVEALVGRRHPEFTDNLEHWKFCDSCYVGGRQWLSAKCGNVFRFYKEGAKEYEDRLKRTYRANHTKRVVETVGQYLFKQRPARDAGAPDLLSRFWDNVDRKQQSMTGFMSYVDRMESVFGQVYIAVDRPAQVAGSRAEERLPYVYLIKPTHVLDMGFDDDGVMTWILIAEDYRDDTSPTASGASLVRVRLWTRDEWYLFAPKDASHPEKLEWLGPEEGYGRHDLGVVPVIPHKSAEGTDYSAPALISDIAYMDRTIVNYGSLLDEILYEQTYSQLTMPAEGLLPGTTEMGQMIAAAKNRVFVYSASSPSAKPEFISPDASQANLIRDAISDLMRTIYAVTGTDNDANSQSMSTGKSYASGTVRQFDHAAIENMLLGKAQALEKTEDRIMDLVFRWMGDDKVEIDSKWVRYPTSFDIRGLQADLAIGLDLAEMSAPVVVAREHMKSMTEKLFPRKSPDEIALIHAAIDEWEPQYRKDAELAERQVEVAEDGNQVSREQIEAQERAAERAAEAQKEAAKAAAKAPKPAGKAA